VTLYLAVPLLVLVAIVQASAVPRLAVWGVYPDLPLVFVACWGYLRGWREGLIWGLIAGLAVDLLSGAPLGAATVAMAAAGLLAGRARSAAPRSSLLVPLVGVFLLTVLYDLIFMLALAVSGQTVLWLETLARIVLPSAVLNGVLAVGVYWLMRVLYTRFGSEEMAW
jgi:rod shape-determining protein MreD